MSKVQMEGLMEKVGSRYKLVILASTRTLELNDGKEKLIEAPPSAKLATVALTEIEKGKVSYKFKKGQKDTD